MRLVGFCFSIYISKKVGSEAVGIFGLIMSIYMFMITLATSGINLATTRIIVSENAKSSCNIKKAMRSCIFYSLNFGIFAFIFLILFAKPICFYFLHNQIPFYIFYIIAISLPFISISSCFNGLFTALRKNGKNAINRIFEQILKMLFTSLLISLFLPNTLEHTILSLILGETISEIGSCIFYVFLYLNERKNFINKSSNSVNFEKQITSIAIPIAITSYIRSGLSSLKQLLIPLRLEKFGLLCSQATSYYGLISQITMQLLLFPEVIINSFSSLVMPEFAYFDAKCETQKIKYAIGRIFRITSFFSIGMIGLFFFFAEDIDFLIYQNYDIVYFIKILSPLLFFMYLDSIVDNILKGLNEQLGVMKCNILDLVVSILCIYFILPIFRN